MSLPGFLGDARSGAGAERSLDFLEDYIQSNKIRSQARWSTPGSTRSNLFSGLGTLVKSLPFCRRQLWVFGLSRSDESEGK
jgi:hypothetical protein